jgi:hypothetical protein
MLWGDYFHLRERIIDSLAQEPYTHPRVAWMLTEFENIKERLFGPPAAPAADE